MAYRLSVCPSTDNERHELSISPSLDRGAQVGRFLVLGLVGRGGMGEVYAAHDPELDRRVAIKLLRHRSGRSHGAGDARARLLREAQAIAKVSHPNVVVVYDVGTFDERIFIAMEFVDGHTLGYWLQAHRRSLSEILNVFTAAGQGLAAAHEKELVHRDFKPDNVMVAADGQVRVMDFGLVRLAIDREREKSPGERTPLPPPVADLTGAAAIDPNATRIIGQADLTYPNGSTLPRDVLGDNLTRVGAIIGTPAYMSPEQFRGEPTDARTDQFSFCIGLYEAVYGERPFPGSTVAELAANVVAGHVRAEPPAARVPASIRKALLRGLSVRPEDRFPSMEALLAALRHEPALSGTQRFAASAAAKLADVWEAPDERQPTETAAKAEIRAAFLATGKSYASAAFEAASRILDRFARRWTEIYIDTCEATHVRGDQSTEVLDLRMAALQEALEDLRALCRELRQATPDTVEKAVNAASSLGTLERCSDVKLLRAIVRPPEDPTKRAAVEQLQVRLTEVRALQRVGRPADAFKQVASLESEARDVGYVPLLAEALYMSGLVYENVGDIERAMRMIEEAVWAAELCRHDEVAAEAATWLVYLAGHVRSRFEAGEIWSRLAETVLRRMGGHDRLWGWLLNNRGAMRATEGRVQEALESQRMAIAAKEKALGPDDPDVAISIGNAATYLDDLGDTAAAAEYAQRAIQIMEGTLGLDHPSAAVVLTNQADFLNRLGRFEEAQRPARRALAVFERETDPDGLYVTYPLMAIGLSHIGLGRCADAISALERAVRIREAKENVVARLADVHWALARAIAGSGGDPARAVALASRAQREYLQAPSTPATRRELADIDRFMAQANRRAC